MRLDVMTGSVAIASCSTTSSPRKGLQDFVRGGAELGRPALSAAGTGAAAGAWRSEDD